MKIYYPAGDRTPDLLNQRQTCYHLSHMQCVNKQGFDPKLLQLRYLPNYPGVKWWILDTNREQLICGPLLIAAFVLM